MKPTTIEEYGLRCLLFIARQGDGKSVTIPEISRKERITPANVAKIMRLLRRGGFVASTRGQSGGYTLARPPDRIFVGEVLALLGGRLFESSFCERHAGVEKLCAHTVECSIRSLWQMVQIAVDQVLEHVTLVDLLEAKPIFLKTPAPPIGVQGKSLSSPIARN